MDLSNVNVTGLLGYLSCTSIALLYSLTMHQRNKRRIANKPASTKARTSEYDVAIVGAGPAGATAAFYLGKKGLKVALIDKKSFPRPKPCGDAWCQPALELLSEMGILSAMEADGIVQAVRRGGFISPFGYACINTDGSQYGATNGCKTYAIKRRIADEYIVRAAAKHSSVNLMENTEVMDARFVAGSWCVDIKNSNSTTCISSTLLFICDGSTSYLAQKLGILEQSQSEAVCSHAYVSGKSHHWNDADGVMIFNRSMLPGYSALFRHYNNDMYFGTYVLPGGKATSRSIAPFETEAIQQHPYVSAAFGTTYDWEERRVVAPIRMGGIKRSFDRQLLIVGDAAGHVDPLTGEGIHTAMIAGKIAATVAAEMKEKNNFTLAASRAYELRCYDAFGYEFFSSSVAARLIVAMPLLLDAVAVVGQRHGQAFLDFFGEVMTGVRPKSDFLQPLLIAEISIEILRQIFVQYVLRAKPLVPQDIGQKVVDAQAGKKAGKYA